MASFVLPLISGIAGLFGGGQQQKQQGTFSGKSTQTQSGSQTQSGQSSTNPNLTPLQQQMINLFTGGAQNLYNQPQDLSGYTANGLQTINQSSDIARKTLDNTLAARGLSYSPASALPSTQIETNRLGQQNQFLNSIPLLQTQLKQNALQGLIQAFGVIPTGVTSSSSGTNNFTGTSDSTQSGNQTGTISGNPWGGAISGLGAGLAAPSSSGGPSNLSSILNMFGFGKPGGNPGDGGSSSEGGGW